jgi:alpha-beta hydrolase superfamily lysophospholipase
MPSVPILPFVLTAGDGARIAAYRAAPEGAPKGIAQIAHGMAEHFGRYARLTHALAAAGYAVYGNDHRGHGASAEVHGLGAFGPGGFQSLVDDMAALGAAARRDRPGLPLALIGHSMGSFAAQLYLLEHHDRLDALVLSGTAAMDLLLADLNASGAPVSLERLNAGFEPARTPFDWLSTVDAEVDAYIADPLCGFAVAEEGMGSMFALGVGARADPRLGAVRKDLPIYVVSGQFDPVVGPDQAFARGLIESYREAGLTRITHRVYPGGRHEMFNERERERVEADLIAWLDANLRTTNLTSS